jgi:hypothetical protein
MAELANHQRKNLRVKISCQVRQKPLNRQTPSSPPPPLYIVDYPHHMRAHLTFGRVDKRHLSQFHPLLRDLGLSRELWREFVHAVDSVPRITWDEFRQIKGNSPTAWAVSVLCLLSALAAFIVILDHLPRNPPGESIVAAAAMAAFFGGCAAALAYAARWSSRPFDQEEVRRTVSSYAATFAKFGVYLDASGEPKVVVVDACLPFAELQRRRQAEDRRREEWEVEQLRLAEQAKIEREKERRQRKAIRDAYYVDRGIKPGPLGWYRVLSDWLQAIVLGLSLALPAAFLLVTLYLFLR